MVDGFIDVGGEFFTLIGDEVFDGSMAAVQIVEKSGGDLHGGLCEEGDELDPLCEAFFDDQDMLVAFRSLGEVDHEITVDPFERLEGGRITLERNGAGTMVRSFPEGAAAAVVVVGFDVGADASPPVSGGHTGAHALGADVGHTFMEEAEGGWLKNGWDDG